MSMIKQLIVQRQAGIKNWLIEGKRVRVRSENRAVKGRKTAATKSVFP